MNASPLFNCIERYEQAVRQFGSRPCIEDGDRIVTYDEFHQLVQQVARSIVASGKGKKVLIALPQGIDAYATIIAVLSVGGCWSPVPPDMPAARQEQIVGEFQPDWIVRSPIAGTLNDEDIPPAATLPDNPLAYVLFTSGTTGRPKGVMVGRRTIDVFLEWSLATYQPTPSDRWGQFARLNFDLSVIDLFTSICGGACLVVLNDLLSQVRPLHAIAQHRISVWHSVPSLIDYMIAGAASFKEELSSLRIASFIGEPLKKYQLDFLFGKHQQLRVINSYGTTEGGLNATWIEMNAASYSRLIEHNVSIGGAIPGWGIHLEEDGEVVIYGEHIGMGYLNTGHDAFRSIAIEGQSYPAFFTGDLAYEKNGLLYFIGRKDHQVKVRGNRIELGEIEFWMTEICGKPVVVLLHEGMLCAFIETQEALDAAWLRQRLMTYLEKVKIPGVFIAVAEFPRNPNFKIIRDRLIEFISN